MKRRTRVRLWWDRLLFLLGSKRRYVVGFDLSAGSDFSATVVARKERDGTYTLVDVSHQRPRGGKHR